MRKTKREDFLCNYDEIINVIEYFETMLTTIKIREMMDILLTGKIDDAVVKNNSTQLQVYN